MSEPSREHVEAVADALFGCRSIYTSAEREDIAERLLVSTHEDALLAAMRDLLVRAGWLHEEVEQHHFVVMDDERNGHWETKDTRRRFAGEWEEIGS